MLKKGFILIAVIILSIGASLYSQQIKPFTDNSATFIVELDQFFGSPKNPNSDFLTFKTNWENNYLSDSIKNAISFFVFKMQERSFKNPMFMHYLVVVNLFLDKDQNSESFFAWMRTLDLLMDERSSTNARNLIINTSELLESQLLCKAASRKWRYRGGRFHYFYDSTLKVKFDGGDLVCASSKDSSEILNTYGIFEPLKNIWRGEEGRVEWSRVDKANEMSAVLDTYTINLKLSQYNADSVLFTDKQYFRIPMLGSLSEKVHGSKPNTRTTYPRFNSYKKDFIVDALLPSMKYIGGVQVQGARFICDAPPGDLAQVFFYKDSLQFVSALSREFTIFNKKITSKRAKILILFGQDSITHPGVQMKFDIAHQELELNRNAKGIAPSPFYDSYHKVDMFCEAIYWNMLSQKLEFGSLRSFSKRSEAVYESANYFSAYDFYRLQGIDPVNPLIVLKKYSEIYNTNLVHLGLLADYIKKPKEQAANMLFSLAERGFVTFDVEDGTAVLKPRLFNYLRAKAGLQDYDIISFESEVFGKSSGTLDLENFDFLLRGIEKIHLSDSQKVQIPPHGKEIVLEQNRNFQFEGLVKGGLLDFTSDSCLFEYDSFKIDMPQIDSVSFWVKSRDSLENAQGVYIPLKSVLSDLSGYVLIDSSDNKSGREVFPEYPIFHNLKEAYVYYDDSTIMNGQLKKEKFYYSVAPFVIDSLDNFSTEGLKFSGYLVSDSIFPVLKDDLSVMGDYSLGMSYMTGDSGLNVYHSKAMFYNEIELSNEGLFGNGKINYLNSSAQSPKFYFYPDSVRASADKFEVISMEDQYDFPDVKAERVKYHWLPKLDYLTIQTTDSLA